MDASFQKYFGISVIIIVSLGGGLHFLYVPDMAYRVTGDGV